MNATLCYGSYIDLYFIHLIHDYLYIFYYLHLQLLHSHLEHNPEAAAGGVFKNFEVQSY